MNGTTTRFPPLSAAASRRAVGAVPLDRHGSLSAPAVAVLAGGQPRLSLSSMKVTPSARPPQHKAPLRRLTQGSEPAHDELTHISNATAAAPAKEEVPDSGRQDEEVPRRSSVEVPLKTAPRRHQRTVHPVVADAVSQAAVLGQLVPHAVVSHRLLDYLGPRFIPTKGGIDINPMGTARASQLIGDLSVNPGELSTVITRTTNIRGTLSVSSVCHEHLRTIRSLCAGYLTSLRLEVDGASFGNSTQTASKREFGDAAVAAVKEASAATARAFGQMRHLRTLHITLANSGAFGEHLDALVLCVAAVLPRLKTLTFMMRQDLPESALFAMAVPNSLESLTIGLNELRRRTRAVSTETLWKPSFGLWRLFSALTSLTVVRYSISPEFLAGAAAGLTSLKRLDLSTCLLLSGSSNVITAFPEGLEELVTGNPGCPGILAAYPHLTRIDSTKATATTESLDAFHRDGCNSVEAFRLRAQNRCEVRVGAVQAAMGHLDALPAVSPEKDAPMVADMTTGNTQLPGLGILKSLSVLRVSSKCLDGLGDRFPSLRSFQCQLHDYHLPVTLSSWCRLRQLHTVEFTAAKHFKTSNWTAVVECLSVIDSTLQNLTVPGGNVLFYIRVATHLPRLASLRVRGCEETALTPTMRFAKLLHAGAILPLDPDHTGPVIVPIETAKQELGPAALLPHELAPTTEPTTANSRRSSSIPRARRATTAAQPTAKEPNVLEFGSSVVKRMRTLDLSALFERPRLLHTFATDRNFDAETAPGLSILFPRLMTITCNDLHPWSSSVKCLRPYWPQLSLKKVAPAE